MNPTDSKWLEILKASGWQTASLTIAFIAIWLLVKNGTIPTTSSPLWEAVPAIGAILCGCLCLGSIGSALCKFYQPDKAYIARRAKRNEINEVRKYIPCMTEKEKEIIGYLLHHNQRLFSTTEDAAYAAPLLSKGIIRCSAQPGQVLDPRREPFEIPDYVWTELVNHREKFPYKPPSNGETETHPWAIHGMAR